MKNKKLYTYTKAIKIDTRSKWIDGINLYSSVIIIVKTKYLIV